MPGRPGRALVRLAGGGGAAGCKNMHAAFTHALIQSSSPSSEQRAGRAQRPGRPGEEARRRGQAARRPGARGQERPQPPDPVRESDSMQAPSRLQDAGRRTQDAMCGVRCALCVLQALRRSRSCRAAAELAGRPARPARPAHPAGGPEARGAVTSSLARRPEGGQTRTPQADQRTQSAARRLAGRARARAGGCAM